MMKRCGAAVGSLLVMSVASGATAADVPVQSLPWEPSTCGGNLLAKSSEFGCGLHRCQCWPCVSVCDPSLGCEDSPAGSSRCQGQCRLTALGHFLNILRWLFVLGCPAIVFGYHILKVQTGSATTRSSEDDHKGVIDGNTVDGLESMLHQDQILDVVMNQVEQQRRMMSRLLWHVMHPLASKEQVTERRHRSRHGRRHPTFPAATQYMNILTPSTDNLAAVAFPPEAIQVEPSNPLDEYIDLGKLHTGHAHGAYVINLHAQIYLETMHENVVPTLVTIVFVLAVATFVAAYNPISMASASVEISRSSCMMANDNCSFLNWTVSPDAVDVPAPFDLIPRHRHRVLFQHLHLPQVPDVLLLELHLTDTRTDDSSNDFGFYQLNMSAPTAPDPSQLVLRYLNRLSTTCSATTCGAIPLAAVYLQRFGASESDVRARRFDIDLVLLSNASAPTSNPPLSFRLVLTAYQDNRAWIAVTVRCCLGTFTALFLVHFLRALNAHLNHRFPDAVQTKSLYFRVWGHMSLERHLMAILLLVLVVQHNPIMLIWTLPWFGPSSHSYIVFRNAWETVVYVVILGSLLIMLDCYRKDCHEFSNGASLKVAGYWFLGVKVALFAGAVVLRLSLALSLEGLFDATVNVAQWVSVVDLLLLVAGFSVFFGVVAIVHRVLEAQRYSHTRYLSLSFRYLTVIAFAILAILLLNTAFSSTYAPVSTTKSTDLTAAALVVEIATAVFVFFAVLAFYPPNKLEPGLIPRVVPTAPPDDSIRHSQPTLPPQATTQPVEALSRATATLLRLPAFRAKACTKPHRLFCLETACLLMNCSRHAYYRSSLNLPNDTSEDGVVAYPATSYVNQTALLRDGLEETMAIHDDGTDTNCLILHSEFRIIFAFRGTDSKANIKTDFEIKLEPFPWLPPESDGSQTPFVHRGFLTAYATVRDKCHAALRDLLRRYDGQGHASDSVQIYCTGHSLGGALATLAALDLKLSFKRDVVMYNYGSPRVGTHSFSRVFNSQMPLAFRVVNEGDIICGLPQRVSMSCLGQSKKLYKHVGTEVVMDGKMNGDFLIRPTFAEKNLIVEVRKKPGRHYLKGYTENLDMILKRCLQSERHHLGDFYMQNALEDALYDDSMDERSPVRLP
ncbi:hypothetical protein H310_13986 [Aphanomyces invadans]|uniref:Fungal lipase-type domain-containing protein n=1 Tax=Aphanomyces invadans TaxID=157072 RepID=A0A024TBP1_9STRA|nr:hypothetical protein H310_13986 [Aphanomyces invadans]ETV91443.1 hypothetical protein H310_13986 [Aphanomyces invadans]|eukprot:XP_008879895.1 hypothetical protein H310_13986 [Aphanomyces invadans]